MAVPIDVATRIRSGLCPDCGSPVIERPFEGTGLILCTECPFSVLQAGWHPNEGWALRAWGNIGFPTPVKSVFHGSVTLPLVLAPDDFERVRRAVERWNEKRPARKANKGPESNALGHIVAGICEEWRDDR